MSNWLESGEDTPGAAKDVLGANLVYSDYIEPLLRRDVTRGAETQFFADNIYAPKYADLAAQVYGIQAPKMGAIGREQVALDALKAAETERTIASGTGADMVSLADKYQRQLDPNFYESSDAVAKGLQDYFAGVNPNALSGSERAELEKTNARQIGYAPGAMDTAARAMNTGTALADKQNRFAGNVAALSSALPQLRSGMDAMKVATGRANTANPGNEQISSPRFDTGQWLPQSRQQWLNNAWNFAQARESVQKPKGEATSSMVGTGIGAIAGGVMCWIARAAFGETDNRWKDFRVWLFFEAPQWVFDFYLSAGEDIARWMKTARPVCRMVKAIMIKILGGAR
jgi:hypothetical protein